MPQVSLLRPGFSGITISSEKPRSQRRDLGHPLNAFVSLIFILLDGPKAHGYSGRDDKFVRRRHAAFPLCPVNECRVVPISRLLLARCGIPLLFPDLAFETGFIRCLACRGQVCGGRSAGQETVAVSHISPKTSEIWGTRRSFAGRSGAISGAFPSK